MARQLCSGYYKAEQSDTELIIVAEGFHRTSGYRVWLEKSPLLIFPPFFELFHEAPTGPVTEVITPFKETARFPTAAPVESVTVVDAEGRHRVPVERRSAAGALSEAITPGRAQPFIEAILHAPPVVWVNMMPGTGGPRSTTIRLNIFLTNTSRSDTTLQVPTPCDEHNWALFDPKGEKVQQFQRPEICPEHVVELLVPAVATVRVDYAIALGPGLLPEQWYRLDYQFMGVDCSTSFLVRYAF